MGLIQREGERETDCDQDILFLAGSVFMCFAVKFCFQLYGLQAFFPLRSLLWYSTQFVPPLSVTAAACADTVLQRCVCVHLYTAAECRRTGLLLNTCPARPVGFSPAEEIKRRWDKKASPWLQATVEAATQEFKISFFSESIYSSNPPSAPSFPFTAFKTPAKRTHGTRSQHFSLQTGLHFLLWFSPPFPAWGMMMLVSACHLAVLWLLSICIGCVVARRYMGQL